MRAYLFELRKKVQKSQVQVSKELEEIIGTKISYGCIEHGYMWSKITKERAAALAKCFNTDTEFILKLEAEQGGFVGNYKTDNYSREETKPNYAVNSHTQYRETLQTALNDKEKELCKKYFSYALNCIDFSKIKHFNNFYISAEDIEEIGLYALVKAIKILSVKWETDTEYMKAIKDYDAYCKWFIRQMINDDILLNIRSEKSDKRKAIHTDNSLDAIIEKGENTDIPIYELTDNKEIPMYLIAESNANLQYLYKYLSEKQIELCKLFIQGYNKVEVVAKGYSKKDIGIIKFYLTQIQEYGKIKWSAEEFKSGEKSVTYFFDLNVWKVVFVVNYKNYRLGYYKELCDAIEVKKIAEYHKNKGDFIEWFNSHLELCQNGKGRKQFKIDLQSEAELYG